MRRRVAAGFLGIACTFAAAAGCGGASLADRIDAAEDRMTDVEDRYRELIRDRPRTTTTRGEVASPTTAPPTTGAPVVTTPTTAAPTTTTQPVSASIQPATAAAVRNIVGSARWDDALPVPATCLANATFAPSGTDGLGGGTLTCTTEFAANDVGEFVARVNDERNLISTGGGTSFQYGGVASITIEAVASGGSRFTATQTYEIQE